MVFSTSHYLKSTSQDMKFFQRLDLATYDVTPSNMPIIGPWKKIAIIFEIPFGCGHGNRITLGAK